jgi:hypothetical protein
LTHPWIAKYRLDPSAILESAASCFEMPPFCQTTPHLTFLGAQAIGRLDFLQWLAPVPLRGLKSFDSQFDSVAWRCLSLCRDAEAMRIAVVVGKDKLGLPIVSMFEF